MKEICGLFVNETWVSVSNHENVYALRTKNYIIHVIKVGGLALFDRRNNNQLTCSVQPLPLAQTQKILNYWTDPDFEYDVFGDWSKAITVTEFVESDLLIIPESNPTSSYAPDYSQIPISALICLAQRFELGEKKHGRDNWRKGLNDKGYLLERLNHILHHTKILQGKLQGFIPWDKDDDIGAILWGATFLCEAMTQNGIREKYIDPKVEV